MGDLGSDYSDNIGAQLDYTYGVSDMFGFNASFGYSSHTAQNLTSHGYSMMHLLTGLRTNLAWFDKVIPYANFGLGFYKPSRKFTTALQTTSLSPVVFGVHLGPGVDLQLTRNLFFGAALTFHDIFGTRRILPDKTEIEMGGTYTSFLLHAGVSF